MASDARKRKRSVDINSEFRQIGRSLSGSLENISKMDVGADKCAIVVQLEKLTSSITTKLDTIIYLLRNPQPAPQTVAPTPKSCAPSTSSVSFPEPTRTQSSPNENEKAHLATLLGRLSTVRKHAYFHQIQHSRIATIYENNLNCETPKIPRKFTGKLVYQDSHEILEIKKKACEQRVRNEVQTLRIYEDSDKHKIQDCDKKATEILIKAGPHMNELKKTWRELCEFEEAGSKEIWAKRESFFTSPHHTVELNHFFSKSRPHQPPQNFITTYAEAVKNQPSFTHHPKQPRHHNFSHQERSNNTQYTQRYHHVPPRNYTTGHRNNVSETAFHANTQFTPSSSSFQTERMKSRLKPQPLFPYPPPQF